MELFKNGIYLINGREIVDAEDTSALSAAGIGGKQRSQTRGDSGIASRRDG